MQIGGEAHTLEARDSMYFDSSTPARLHAAPGASPARRLSSRRHDRRSRAVSHKRDASGSGWQIGRLERQADREHGATAQAFARQQRPSRRGP